MPGPDAVADCLASTHYTPFGLVYVGKSGVSNAPDYEIQLANPGRERRLQTNRGVALVDATPIADVHGPIDTDMVQK